MPVPVIGKKLENAKKAGLVKKKVAKILEEEGGDISRSDYGVGPDAIQTDKATILSLIHI